MSNIRSRGDESLGGEWREMDWIGLDWAGIPAIDWITKRRASAKARQSPIRQSGRNNVGPHGETSLDSIDSDSLLERS